MRTLYKGATIIDGTGAAPIRGEMLIEDGVILAVGPLNSVSLDNYPDADIVDQAGKFIIPGLINSHLHILADATLDGALFVACNESAPMTAYRGYKNMQILLRSGVTYARDLGGYQHINLELKKMRHMGLIGGADLVSAGEAITTTGGHIWRISRQCDGVAEIRKGVREQISAGADCIKMMITGGYSTPGVYPKTLQFTRDEIEAAVEVAHNANKKICSHTYGLKAIKMAVEAGIDCIEHCEFFPDDNEDEISAVIETMAKAGTYYVPTLSAWYKDFPAEYGSPGPISEAVLNTELLRQPDHIRPVNMKREYYTLKQIFDKAARLYQGGVRIAMGTDAGIRGIFFDRHAFEMKCMAYIGMSPMEVIMASTKTAAELLGISLDYGTLEKGKAADFVVLDQNPLSDMDNLRVIRQVFKKGQAVL